MARNVFWDSNIFIAFLKQESAYKEYLEVMEDILETPDYRIFSSQLALAEVSMGKIEEAKTKSFVEFVNTFQQTITLIPTTPNIWINAGKRVRHLAEIYHSVMP